MKRDLWAMTAMTLALVMLAPPLIGAEPNIGCALRIVRGKPAQHTGTNGDDKCRGLPTEDIMRGLRGDDRLRGMGSRDIVKGNRGADRLKGVRGDDDVIGGLGADLVKGGRGDDRLVGGNGRDLICLGRGTNRVRARDGMRDRVYAAGADDDVDADPKDAVLTSACSEKLRRRIH